MPTAFADLNSEFAARFQTARTALRPVPSGASSRVIGLRFDVEGLDLPIGATVRLAEPGLDLSGEVVAVGCQRSLVRSQIIAFWCGNVPTASRISRRLLGNAMRLLRNR